MSVKILIPLKTVIQTTGYYEIGVTVRPGTSRIIVLEKAAGEVAAETGGIIRSFHPEEVERSDDFSGAVHTVRYTIRATVVTEKPVKEN